MDKYHASVRGGGAVGAIEPGLGPKGLLNWRYPRQACLTSLDLKAHDMFRNSELLTQLDSGAVKAWMQNQGMGFHHETPTAGADQAVVGSQHTHSLLANDPDLGMSFKHQMTIDPRHWGSPPPRDTEYLLCYSIGESPVFFAFFKLINKLTRQNRKVLVFCVHPWVQL
ncbi:hypothetical protein GQ53DRAFT_259850 [Thozetella sp. PMI_491]|nr:hypothetical protein GQ53DRAFT_259850 [Thozetella sp. PMI_491]